MLGQGQRVQARSRITQCHAGSLSEAGDLMNANNNNPGSNNQCIMAMVRRSYQCCCCDIKMDVPANFTVLEEDCGASQPLMTAGAHWCYFCNRRVVCLLSKNIVNYDAPVQKCPTKDNAYVDVDIHFTFRLPMNNEKLVHMFVYKLGAGRFDELLAAEVEENIRNFINTIFLHQVFDLKSDMANDMMQQLNGKFYKYGITFEQCNVTGVHVNPQLVGALTEKTRLKIELKNHQKEQENLKLTLENEEQQKLTLLENENRRKYHLLEEQIKRAVIEQAQSEKEATTKNQKMIIDTEGNSNQKIINAEGDRNVIVKKVQADTIQKINRAQADANAMIIDTDKKTKVMGIEQSAKLADVKATYQTLIQECAAEQENLAAIDAQREHDYEMNKAEAYKQLAGGANTQIVMSGASGQNMIDKIFKF